MEPPQKKQKTAHVTEMSIEVGIMIEHTDDQVNDLTASHGHEVVIDLSLSYVFRLTNKVLRMSTVDFWRLLAKKR
jgi:hypothetical protein